ncbi:hypothetical protein BD779DRAFT_1485310 [Infundibulicybe gibba]|nr:hypothetical protein BD779DRAFT_1485310 [Infundibulicybe gibba]
MFRVARFNFRLSTARPLQTHQRLTKYTTATPSQRTKFANSLCPVCSQPLPSPLPACTNCWNIFQIPKDVTFHDLFSLPYEPNPFNIDIPTLKHRFREAQSLCHPDSWASKGSNKQDVAQALSSRINEAYQCLLKPLSRVEYLLERHHLPMSESDQLQDMEFMVDIMEARETIDDAEDSSEIHNIVTENTGKMEKTLQELETFVAEQNWASVKAAAIRLRYLEGIDRATKKWLDNH